MKSATFAIVSAVALTSSFVQGYSSFSGKQLQTGARNAGNSMTMEYVPDGMTREQWRKIKEAEKNKNKGKDLGKVGITSFKSRSFAEWQKSGGKNLFPVDPKSVKDPKEIPYMQRAGGAADGSDLKGGGKKSLPTFFTLGGKKTKEPEPEPEPKKKNWWTLN
mmetsp:Transcript_16557/g.34614  ORF Transcript_16557/g.34614 Transcript_16557/m.34614 type:complete len:162 (+) Transcript_16557:99-584(+)